MNVRAVLGTGNRACMHDVEAGVDARAKPAHDEGCKRTLRSPLYPHLRKALPSGEATHGAVQIISLGALHLGGDDVADGEPLAR